MKQIDIIREYYSNCQEDFEDVDFFKAHEPNIKTQDCLKHSGIFQINKLISEKLNEIKFSYFLDFSSILSTIKSNELQDFIYLNNSGDFFSIENVQNKYLSLYKWLEEENFGIFYQNEFMNPQKKIQCYSSNDRSEFSLDNDHMFQSSGSENSKINLDKLRDNNAYFLSIKLPLSYRDFSERLQRSPISIDKAQEIFHYNLKNNFLQKPLDVKTYLLSIPLIGALSNSSSMDSINVLNGQGGIFIFVVTENDLDDSIIEELSKDIFYLAKDVTFKYLVKVGLELLEESKRKAIKSAKAAIMARNMSHNLGSHVMSYLKQHLYSVTDILQHNVLKNLIEDQRFCSTIIDNNDQVIGIIKDTELPFLVGMGRFINYLQERQDFIATISTDFIPYFSDVNLKDAIFDELNPDYRHERHSDRSGYKPDNLLLQFLAKSEEFSRNSINICFRRFDGKNDKTYNSYGRTEVQGEGLNDLNVMRQIELNLPGGIIGRQAIFSIFENVIRNSAKHGSIKEKLEIVFDILNYSVEEEKTKIDNLLTQVDSSVAGYFRSNIHELYLATVSDNMGNGDDVNIKTLRGAIKESYINDDGSLKETNKGIKEIRISTTWLNGLNDDKKQIIDVIKTDDNNIQYIFTLLKPRRIAYIFDNNYDFDEEKIKELKKYNWFIYNEDQYRCESNRSFNIIVFDNIDLKNKLDEITHFRRIVKKFEYNFSGNEDLKEWCLSQESEYFKDFANEFIGDTSAKLIIVDAKAYVLSNDEFKNSTVFITDNNAPFNDNVIFKTHYQNRSQLKDLEKFFNNNKIKPRFVEGISGHNSTDRLIRQETWGPIWQNKQKVAALTKIAIIDERIFERGYNIDTSLLRSIISINSEYEFVDIKKIINNPNEISEYIANELKRKNFDESIIESISEGIDSLDRDKEDYITRIKEIIKNRITNSYNIDDYYYMILFRKNITLFTLLWDNDTFKLIGVKINETNAEVCTVGNFCIEDNAIQFTLDKDYKNQFQLISIHQGLLDKIYQHFNIKTNSEENQKKKIEITDDLHKQMVKNSTQSKKGIIIHSGRSQPSIADMPQKLPFVQYAALENAVFDCKYTLFDLLTSARYDPQK